MTGKQNTAQKLAAAFSAAVLAGCAGEYMELGNNWVDVGSRVIVIDTCSVDLSSVMLDSVKTSCGSSVFAGRRESRYWGTTAISSYLTFKTTGDYDGTSTPEYSERIIFDSLTLYMVPDSTFCGDTTLPMTLSVFRLAERMELNDDDELYAHSEFATESSPIASKTFMPRPFRGRAVEIRLSDDLGRELLDKVTEGDPDVEDDDSFAEYFKGLYLTSSDPTSSVMGFKSTDSLCMMKLYYRSQDYAEPEEHVLEFRLDSTCISTHVEHDFSGSPLSGLTDKEEEVSSTGAGNLAFASGMLGIYTKLGFPYLNNLRSIGEHCYAASAVLTVYPKEGTYCRQNYSSLPPELNLYISDENNISTGGAITDSDGETLQTGSLTYDDMMFPESTYYTYDITDFINDQFGKIGVNKNFLQMIDPDYGYTLDELVIGDRYSDGYNVKLTITLAVYDE